ncbi:hypothetical protein [Bacillus nakamurai]|nr:hypothetical protein [Bacillus nakamurai]MCC9021784.1 hypothetical protein [Bacillus nakamurai]
MNKEVLIEVGTKVFLKPVNNAARYGKKEISEKIVQKKERNTFMWEHQE